VKDMSVASLSQQLNWQVLVSFSTEPVDAYIENTTNKNLKLASDDEAALIYYNWF